MKVIFVKHKSINALAIRFFTWSRYHHCGALFNGLVYEATAFGGVVATPLNEFYDRYKNADFVVNDIECDDAKALQFLKNQLGKKYDWLSVFGIFFRAKVDDKNKWFCSELVGAASYIFRKDRLSRITPEHLWMISK